ncbi:MAG: GAF domain-containing protein [Chitinophagaceae bacterium]
MISANLPASEPFRLLDLASYDIMDTPSENDFDELVELAAQICDCPISLITLLDKDRQWFKAKTGLEDTSTSRDVAFCAHAILQDEVFVVENAKEDIRFADNPLVTGDLNIGFYAGAPIISPAGYKLGTVCVIDSKPRALSAKEERALTILSNQVTKLLELRKKNQLIRQHANEIIHHQSSTIGLVLQNQEDEKKSIANTLHEDMAQGIAASLFFLQTAESDRKQAPDFIKMAQEQLNSIMGNMQTLSYSLTPHVIDILPAKKIIGEYTERIASACPFSIDINITGMEHKGAHNNTVTIIRIIEQWLKILAQGKDVTEVRINLHAADHIELVIEDNGNSSSAEQFKRKIADSLVYERANACGGTVESAVSMIGNSLLKIKIPLLNAA